MKIGFLTYGCKVNQYETERIKQALLKEGVTEESSGMTAPDIYIINTCTVTGKIDKEIERKIRQIKEKSNARIVLTGCLVQRDFDKELNKFVDWVIPNDKKYSLDFYPDEIKGQYSDTSDSDTLQSFSDKNKAFVKIEDGCNNYCAYCEIPYVRGDKIISRSIPEIVCETENLVKKGYKEIILTGINLGLYGAEKGLKNGLLEVLKELVRVEGLGRLRLSSIGPMELEDATIDFIAENKDKICPHFHMSIQSGCDRILKLMKRKYTSGDYAQKVSYILKKMPDAAITTDLITGFPGENDDDHKQTVEFVKGIEFSRIHVFPYSDRPDTAASKLENKIGDKIKKKRMSELLEIASDKQRKFAEKFMNKKLEVLIESGGKNGYNMGYTENYIRVVLKDAEKYVNNLVPVIINEVDGEKVIGEIMHNA